MPDIAKAQLLNLVNRYDREKGFFRKLSHVDSTAMTKLKAFLGKPEVKALAHSAPVPFYDAHFRKFTDADPAGSSLSTKLLKETLPSRDYVSALRHLKEDLDRYVKNIETRPWQKAIFSTSGTKGLGRAKRLLERVNAALMQPNSAEKVLSVLEAIKKENWGSNSATIIDPRLKELLSLDLKPEYAGAFIHCFKKYDYAAIDWSLEVQGILASYGKWISYRYNRDYEEFQAQLKESARQNEMYMPRQYRAY